MTITEYLLFLIVPAIFGMWAQSRVKSAFAKYAQVRVSSNMTGAEAARQILREAQINDVSVEQIDGFLGDHYDPTSKRLCLSSDIYNNPSVAAVGIAAHESGHAIQHAKAYAPLKLRSAIVPVTQLASNLLPIVIIGGFFFGIFGLMKLGVLVYLVLLVFQLVTLPVEYDASRRAKIILQQMRIVQPGAEAQGVDKVLDAAALTYVASFVAVLGNLLYLLTLTNRRSN